jgi:hypothetical protein
MHHLLKSKITIAFLFILLSHSAFAQDFTGVWSGFIYVTGNKLPYELVIGKTGDKLQAYSLTVFTIEGVENTGIKEMKTKAKKKQLSIEDDELIYDNYTTPGKKLTLYSTLSLQKEDAAWILSGPFFTRSADRSSFKGTIRLKKQDNLATSKLVFHLERMNLFGQVSFKNAGQKDADEKTTTVTSSATVSLQDEETKSQPKTINQSDITFVEGQKKEITQGAVPKIADARPAVVPPKTAAAEINSRKTELIRDFFFQSDSLVFSLYDNGEVDGDTVSVVLNNQIIMARQGLTTTPVMTTYYFNETSPDSLNLVMYAENLGRIPPNTGVLIIRDGNERYHIRFEGDYQKNSAVILRRRRQ